MICNELLSFDIMGIFRYFYWHFKTYPESVTYVNQPEQIDGFDILGLDLNAIFHPVCQAYFFDKKMSVRGKKTNEACFQAICEEIERIVLMATPKEELILAIDGVAGLSKMNQQRQRRFRSAKEKTNEDRAIFDSNQISTGTEFLSDLSNYITRHFTKDKRPYKIVVFDEKTIGEGEHKIVRYIEPLQKKRVCIYSPDADLIMLGIGLHKKNIFILRPNIYSNIRCSHFLVHIDVFRKQIIELIDPQHMFPHREDQIVNDFVFLLYFLGNDFLPHSPSFEIKYKGIDRLLAIYSQFFQEGGFLVRSNPYSIHTQGFQRMMTALAKEEVEMIKIKQMSFKGFPNPLLDKYISHLDTRFDEYRREYYQHYFPENTPIDVCRDYVVGLLFVGTYYYQGMPDWQYCYPYYHGPFFHELEIYSKSIKSEWIHVNFDPHQPLSPLVQLACVLPPESKRWLPECIQSFYDAESPILDLYPSQFKIDLDGVQNEYEGIVLLPRIDITRVEKEFERVKHQLTAREKTRNKHAFLK
jgi:5'-3' exoribonuclease 1